MTFIQNIISQEDALKIMQGDFSTPIVIHDFLTPDFAEKLFLFLKTQDYLKIEADITKKYVLRDRLQLLSQESENPFLDWYNLVSTPDFFLYKLALLPNKKGIAYIKEKSINVHKYIQGDFHKFHKDNEAKEKNSLIEEKGWGKYIGFHLSLTQGWKQGDGGELNFYLDNGETISEPPIFNTLWIYSAIDLAHEVKPILSSTLNRYVLLNMYYGKIY